MRGVITLIILAAIGIGVYHISHEPPSAAASTETQVCKVQAVVGHSIRPAIRADIGYAPDVSNVARDERIDSYANSGATFTYNRYTGVLMAKSCG